MCVYICLCVCAQKTTVNVTSRIYRNFAEIIEATAEQSTRGNQPQGVSRVLRRNIIVEQTNKQAAVLDS